jgi:hypothetical protein
MLFEFLRITSLLLVGDLPGSFNLRLSSAKTRN